MRGFTTVRDLGGPSFALKRAIDEGVVIGPRIYPSGAMITTTGTNGELLRLSGRRNPYPGRLGVVQEAHSPICCWSMAIRWRTSSSSKTPARTSWSP
jgi:hypothetical protein